MTQPRAHPDLWYAIAQLLAALRRLLRVTAPEAFAQIAPDARAWLAALTAMVRRYIHILAGELVLPPQPKHLPAEQNAEDSRARQGRRVYRFPLIEAPSTPGAASASDDPPELQWALLMEAVQRLVGVLASPASHALRLARALRRLTGEALRELAVRWSILRRIGAGADTLLIRLDQLARPTAWQGIDTS